MATIICEVPLSETTNHILIVIEPLYMYAVDMENTTLTCLMTVNFILCNIRVKDMNLEKDVPLVRRRAKSHYITEGELRESRREDDQKRFYYNYQYR